MKALIRVAAVAAAALACLAVDAHEAPVALTTERLGWAAGLLTGHALLAELLIRLRPPRWLMVAGAGGLLAAAGGWWTLLRAAPAQSPGGDVGEPGGGDVILITLDTFRADHLGAQGGAAHTPHLDALAESGVRFSRAMSPAPLTAPAHASMLTGLEPWKHGVLANGVTLTAPTVVERIRASGYATGATLGARVLDRGSGLAQGFSWFDDRWGSARHAWLPWRSSDGAEEDRREMLARDGGAVVDRALAWWRQTDKPRLLWVHLYDPHTPYRDHGGAVSFASTDERGPRRPGLAGLLQAAATGLPEERRARYRAEIKWTDACVGRLLEGVGDEPAVIVAGDHGESLGEHDYWFNHGARLYEPALHVPLIIRWPGRLPAGQVSDDLVGLIDVAPLLLAMTGLEDGGGPLIDGAPARTLAAYTTGQEARATLGYRSRDARWRRGRVAALRVPGGKLMAFEGSPPVWFDLEHDPDEADPLEVPQDRASLLPAARAMLSEPEPALSAEERERLAALGYVTH